MLILFDNINILLSITVALNIFLGFIILKNGHKKKINRVYSFNILAIIGWVLAMFFYRSAGQDTGLFWGTVLYVVPTFIASSFLYFTYIFPSEKDRSTPLKSSLIFLINAIIVAMVVWPGFIIKEVNIRPGLEKEIIFTQYYWFYFFYTLTFFSYGFQRLFQKYLKEIGIERLQIIYLLAGYALAANLAFVTNLILPWLGYFSINWLGQVCTIIMVSFTTYAIVRYRFLDVRIFARKIFVYFGASVVAYVTFYAILWFENNFLGGAYSNKSYLVGIALAVTFVLVFQQSSKWIEKLANKYFFFALYNYQETINRVSDQLTHYTDLVEIDNLVTKTIKESLGINKVAISLTAKNSRTTKTDPLLKYLTKNQRPVVLEELSLLISDERLKNDKETFQAVYEQVNKLEAAICLPLISNERLIGLISLGPKVIDDPFTVEDLELLMTLSNQAAIAIDNAELYKEVKDFNKTLKQKVNEQTADLQTKAKILEDQAEHLKKLLAMRSEFLDIASHQLKTPISVIMGTASMFKEGSVQKMPIETQNKLIDNIYQKSIKISQIIRDILQASEFDTEKFEFVAQRIVPVEVNKLLSEVVSDHQAGAVEKKLQLSFAPNANNPQINSDPEYLEQALANLVDNAIKYSKEGQINVTLDESPQSVMIKIKDTGVGIPKADQARMFGKFERAKNAVNMYTDGSGLGLFITREIIQAHPGGTITFTSEEGQGTEFVITLPKAKK